MAAPKESRFLCVIPRIALHQNTDDSHIVLHGMPKKPLTGNNLFRRQPLSLFFVYACHIRKGTYGKRNLYLSSYLII